MRHLCFDKDSCYIPKTEAKDHSCHLNPKINNQSNAINPLQAKSTPFAICSSSTYIGYLSSTMASSCLLQWISFSDGIVVIAFVPQLVFSLLSKVISNVIGIEKFIKCRCASNRRNQQSMNNSSVPACGKYKVPTSRPSNTTLFLAPIFCCSANQLWFALLLLDSKHYSIILTECWRIFLSSTIFVVQIGIRKLLWLALNESRCLIFLSMN